MPSDLQSPLAPTPASEWRKPREEGYLVELPSGHRARLGPVDLSQMLLDGRIPDLLTPFVTQMLYEGVNEEDLEKQFSPEAVLDRAGETMELINRVCSASFLDPRVVQEDPGDGEILIEDVSIDDRSYVFSLAIYGARALESFRVGQESPVEPVRDGEDDDVAPEPDAGDRE